MSNNTPDYKDNIVIDPEKAKEVEFELRKENTKLKELLSETLDVIKENSRLSETIGRERVLPRNKGLIKRIKEVLK